MYTTPQPVAGGYRFVDIAVGSAHTCAIDTDGKAWCWGNQANGRLGNGVTTNQDWGPVVILGDSFLKLSASPAFTCGITTDHVLKCWGLALGGCLGTGVTSGSYGTPQTVASSLG